MTAAWKHHRSGIFDVDIPGDWLAEEHASGTLLIRDPEQRVAVMLNAVSKPHPDRPLHPGPAGLAENPLAGWSAAVQTAEGELARWIARQHKVKVTHPPQLVSGAPNVTCTTEGWESVRRGVTWLKRLLCRGPTLFWRFWAVVNTHMLVLASCNGQSEIVERYRPTVDRIIGSLHLPERDLLVGRDFTEAVASLARNYFPLTAVALIDERHLRFGACHVDVMTLHRRYLQAPEQLSSQVKTFFLQVQRLNEGAASTHEWEEVRSHILPVLVETARLGRYGADCVHEEWVNDLYIVYVVDGGATACRSVAQQECRAWGIDVETLHERALVNLVARSRELTMEGSRADGYTMLALTTNDPHNAARILLPDLYRKLREHLGSVFYVAIPGREFLVAFNTQDPEVLARVRRQMASDYARLQDPVSPRLFQITPDGIAGDPEEDVM